MKKISVKKQKVACLLLAMALVISTSGCGFFGSAKNAEPSVEDVAGEESVQSDTTTKESTEAQQAEEEPSKSISVTISATGDCALGKLQTHEYANSFDQYYDTYGQEYFFDGVRHIFAKDDFTVVDLECALTNREERVDQEYSIKGKPEYSNILSSSSVEGAVLWNNHTSDYGPESLADTKNALTSAGVGYAYGTELGRYTTQQGITIGYVSVMMIGENQDRVNIMIDGINQLKAEGADIILACCHWGIEREYYPTEFQQRAAHQIVDAGADAVIGCHPHVLQGMEYYNGKVICYSLGNFCFGANRDPVDKDSVIYQQTFTFVDGEKQTEVDAQIIPVKISSKNVGNDFQPTVQTGDSAKNIIQNMNTYSAPYSSLQFDEEGKVVISQGGSH